jgi:hypothetical protein
VIRYLHHSTKTEDIKQELAKLGHRTRNIFNVHHKATKEPLNLFFVDLEPVHNNKTVYEITGLQNRIVKIEPRHSKQTSSNARDVSSTDILNHTAICLMYA